MYIIVEVSKFSVVHQDLKTLNLNIMEILTYLNLKVIFKQRKRKEFQQDMDKNLILQNNMSELLELEGIKFLQFGINTNEKKNINIEYKLFNIILYIYDCVISFFRQVFQQFFAVIQLVFIFQYLIYELMMLNQKLIWLILYLLLDCHQP